MINQSKQLTWYSSCYYASEFINKHDFSLKKSSLELWNQQCMIYITKNSYISRDTVQIIYLIMHLYWRIVQTVQTAGVGGWKGQMKNQCKIETENTIQESYYNRFTDWTWPPATFFFVFGGIYQQVATALQALDHKQV